MSTEVITVATVLTGAGGGIVVPFVNKILGPAADELGMILSDRVRMFRLEKQIKLFAEAQMLLAKAGLEPKQVSLKTLLPLMEHASLEEDFNLSQKWSALLANAANSTSLIDVIPAFNDILRQMSPSEAELLDYIFRQIDDEYPASKDNALGHRIDIGAIENEKAELPGRTTDFESDLDSLLRNRILVNSYSATHISDKSDRWLYFTSLGYDFMLACLPPELVNEINSRDA